VFPDIVFSSWNLLSVFVYTRGATQRYKEDQVVVRVTDEVDLVKPSDRGAFLRPSDCQVGTVLFWRFVCLQSPFGIDRTCVSLLLVVLLIVVDCVCLLRDTGLYFGVRSILIIRVRSHFQID